MPLTTVDDLTQGTLEGTGVFDELMRATKAHLQEEFSKNRLKGSEYSQVYLGSMQYAMQNGVTFLLEKDKAFYQAQLVQAQVTLAEQQAANAIIEGQNLTLQSEVLRQQALTQAAERENMLSQKAINDQKILNLKAEASLVDEQVIEAQKRNALDGHVDQELAQLVASTTQATAQTDLIEQQSTNLAAEALNIPKVGAKTDADTALAVQEKLNAVTQETVLVAQECKLRAEFDMLMKQVGKAVAETDLLNQKQLTEQAQISGTGVAVDSVLGRQKAMHKAQAEGYVRDAEQKAARIMADTWNVRRTTDDATSANASNKLDDASVGRAIDQMLGGVNA